MPLRTSQSEFPNPSATNFNFSHNYERALITPYTTRAIHDISALHPSEPGSQLPPDHRTGITMSKDERPTDGAPPTEPTKPPAKIDPVYYNWSNTFTILLSRMNGARDPALEQKYFTEQDAINGDRYCKRCETSRDYLLQYSPIIRFLTDEVGKLGGDLNKNNIHCRLCTNEQSGGFHLDHGILLCANKFRNRGHQEDTMAHEMVHAWDHLKWKVEDDNLKHQACLEVCISHEILPYLDGYLGTLLIELSDPCINPLRRMSLHPRVLHQKPMANHRAVAELC
jgi:hypothetical protein